MDAWFASNVSSAQKSFWMHLMELLGDVRHVESRFGPFGDSANLDARWMHGIRRTYHRLRNHFWTHPMELLGDVGHVESRFGPFGDNVNGCVVCTKHTIGLEIILDAPDGTPW
jgi:hypothetical protein